ncbi:MAG: esterase/lipase family protein [Micavibrio sp.]
MSDKIGPPALTLTFTETVRASAEAWVLGISYNLLKNITKQGDGRPVLILPGFGGGDTSTAALRKFLNEKGYHAEGWNYGTNKGPSPEVLVALKARLEQMSAEHGGQKVTLIGHSLGGIYARELARSFPKKVSQVITLGSPFRAGMHPESTATVLRKLFMLLNGRDHRFLSDESLARLSEQPPPVPTTSIYSRGDGIVNWRACLNPKRAMTENIEITGSHCGMVINPLTYLVLADRLAQDVQKSARKWKPFQRENYLVFSVFPAEAHHGHEPESAKKSWQKNKNDLFQP